MALTVDQHSVLRLLLAQPGPLVAVPIALLRAVAGELPQEPTRPVCHLCQNGEPEVCRDFGTNPPDCQAWAPTEGL